MSNSTDEHNVKLRPFLAILNDELGPKARKKSTKATRFELKRRLRNTSGSIPRKKLTSAKPSKDAARLLLAYASRPESFRKVGSSTWATRRKKNGGDQRECKGTTSSSKDEGSNKDQPSSNDKKRDVDNNHSGSNKCSNSGASDTKPVHSTQPSSFGQQRALRFTPRVPKWDPKLKFTPAHQRLTDNTQAGTRSKASRQEYRPPCNGGDRKRRRLSSEREEGEIGITNLRD